MNRRSALLSLVFVALVSASAYAADLPATKGQAIEYVRVCSQFGPGFFYLPGTDTCLKIGGYYRADYTVGGKGAANSRNTQQTAFQGRAQLGFDARTQTDYGLLRSYFLINGVTGHSGNQTWAFGSVDGTVLKIDRAFIQFGDLTAGYSFSQYSFFDRDFGNTFFAPYYGSGGLGKKNQLAYTAELGSGISATLSLEDPAGDTDQGLGNALNSDGVAGARWPEIVGNIQLQRDWGSLQVMGVAHQIRTVPVASVTTGSLAAGQSSWGYAIGAGGNVKFPLLAGGYVAVEASYADGASAYTGLMGNQSSAAGSPDSYDAYIGLDGNLETVKSWDITSEAGLKITAQWSALIFGSYGKYDAPSSFPDFESYVAGAQIKYEIAKGLTIGGEVYYANTSSDEANIYNAQGELLPKSKSEAWVGGLRIERKF